jgi:hypothetical protein
MSNYTQEQLNRWCGDFETVFARIVENDKTGWIPSQFPIMETLSSILDRQRVVINGLPFGLAEGDYSE